MAKIIAAGDSFVWGSELADSPHGGPDGYSRNTFAALLAKDCNYEYKCVAYPGASNSDIAKQVRNSIKDNQTFVIVSWTWPTRDNKLVSDDEILETQQYLEYHNYGYMFTCADNCIITNNLKIKWENWFLFPVVPNTGWHQNENPRGFYQWALEHKYELAAKDKHPLEQAHYDAAALMKDKFYELVKKHIQ